MTIKSIRNRAGNFSVGGWWSFDALGQDVKITVKLTLQPCAASAFDTICSSEPKPATASTITA